jgi:hypothetical protein
MPITDSRLLNGTLSLGATGSEVAFECQITNVLVEQEDGDEEDSVTTLCGDTIGGAATAGPWHITGTVIQDWDVPTSITEWSYTNRNTLQVFEFVPNDSATAPTITGSVHVKFLGIGGDVNARITRDFDWGIDGEPTFTWGGAVAADVDEGAELVEA